MKKLAGAFIDGAARASCAVEPRFLAAFQVRAFLACCMRRGEKKLEKGSALGRVATRLLAPVSTLDLQVSNKTIQLRMIPLAIWFKSSYIARVLSRSQLLDISGRFTEKACVLVVLPAGLSLPVGFTPGTLVDATGSVLEWLLDRFLLRT